MDGENGLNRIVFDFTAAREGKLEKLFSDPRV